MIPNMNLADRVANVVSNISENRPRGMDPIDVRFKGNQITVDGGYQAQVRVRNMLQDVDGVNKVIHSSSGNHQKLFFYEVRSGVGKYLPRIIPDAVVIFNYMNYKARNGLQYSPPGEEPIYE